MKLVPPKKLCAVSYSPSIVTMAVSVAVREIFSVKERCDLENRVRSRSLEVAPFDRSHRVPIRFRSNHGDILYRLRDIATYCRQELSYRKQIAHQH